MLRLTWSPSDAKQQRFSIKKSMMKTTTGSGGSAQPAHHPPGPAASSLPSTARAPVPEHPLLRQLSRAVINMMWLLETVSSSYWTDSSDIQEASDKFFLAAIPTKMRNTVTRSPRAAVPGAATSEPLQCTSPGGTGCNPARQHNAPLWMGNSLPINTPETVFRLTDRVEDFFGAALEHALILTVLCFWGLDGLSRGK